MDAKNTLQDMGLRWEGSSKRSLEQVFSSFLRDPTHNGSLESFLIGVSFANGGFYISDKKKFAKYFSCESQLKEIPTFILRVFEFDLGMSEGEGTIVYGLVRRLEKEIKKATEFEKENWGGIEYKIKKSFDEKEGQKFLIEKVSNVNAQLENLIAKAIDKKRISVKKALISDLTEIREKNNPT